MLFKKALLMGYSGKELDDSHFQRIDKACEKRIILSVDDPNLNTQLKDTDCLLVKLGAKVGEDVINKAPNLKYIGMLGTGYGGIDIKYAADKGIAVCNIADYATEAVAELTFAVLLEYLREIERAKNQARDYDFSESTYFNVTEIKGKTFGVIGLGHIGCRVAEIANSFGAKVKYWSLNRKSEHEDGGLEYLELDDLLQSSDIVSLNIAYNNETQGFLDSKRIQLLKNGAVLINLSPMELVDLDGILYRVKQKDIVFILDHSDEMADKDINKMKALMKVGSNLIVYPPVAYTTKEASKQKKEIFVKNIEGFIAGKPENKVN